MANQEHVDILRQGVEVWNKWRKEHQEVKPDLSGANLRYCDLSEADLSHAMLSEANLSRAMLSRAMLSDADLSSANLICANLSHVHLYSAKLKNANLSHAYLYSVGLNGANLWNARLINADLSLADLSLAKLNGADLSGVNLEEAKVGWTVFVNIDMRSIRGLEMVIHGGPSYIGIETIYKSGGNIPESFLRGAGVPEIFIEYMRSLVGKPIEYYTCFISYSSKDQEFAERLYADLQAKNVRCWYAPEDLKIGDKFRVRIDESIRLYDKLLLILSKHSVKSPWVETEVETAFSKEHKTGKLVLFPVKIDNTVEETEEAWAATVHRTRHIGDFTRWKEHDEYQKGLKILLCDLKQNIINDGP
jgi:hypothetical protein